MMNRKRYQQIRKFDHQQMEKYEEDTKKEERERVIKAFTEALENVPGIGKTRREAVMEKVNELMNQKGGD